MDDVVAQRAGYLLLQFLDAIGLELDDVARIEINQMVMVLTSRGFET